MTEKETTLPPIQDTLSKLYKFDLGDFNIYADSEEFFAQFESFDFFVAAYQYCAKVAAVFGRLIGEKELDFEGHNLRPFDFIMITTALSYKKQFDFWEYIEKLGINIEDCEEIMRNSL